jgi:multiple antibiotic resistance protein
MSALFNSVLALLALINPVSKIFILSTLAEGEEPGKLKRISVRSSVIACCILVSFALVGKFILQVLFHVQLYSFQIVGGIVLFIRGFQALNKGLFFEVESNQKLEDASIVPLASPMIAGPATLTAAISFPVKYGLIVTLIAIIIAVIVNFWVMLSSQKIAAVLQKHNLMGALIRITGLIVATIGVQMMLEGIYAYLQAASIILK